VGGGALVVLYLFMRGLERTKVEASSANASTPSFLEEDTLPSWTYEDLPTDWPSEPDDSLASLGEELFNTRGCKVCHTVGEGELVGPDLKGIDERRPYRWTLLLLLRPDSMQRDDSLARALLKRYGVQMPNQRLTLDEAEAILHYVLRESSRP